MTHRFPIKEVALQAGLSTATVDRVINNRANVSPQTRLRVAGAIEELEGQEAQLAARGRRMFIDFVVEAPARFSDEVRRAAEDVLSSITTAVCRPRFSIQEIMTEQDVVANLRRIAKRGSQGVCLKARDLPLIRAAIDELAEARIPVVTLVTDISSARRTSYTGLDNPSAGRTAAYLIARTLADQSGVVLTTKSQDSFLGEEERDKGFVETLNHLSPNLWIVDVSGGSGVASETARAVEAAHDKLEGLVAVYSMGGANAAILQVLSEHNLIPQIYVAHDLDRDNKRLLEAGHIDYVLHHDLKVDIRNAYLAILHHHRLAPMAEAAGSSAIQIITPMNLPR